jgi:hypothetical protein
VAHNVQRGVYAYLAKRGIYDVAKTADAPAVDAEAAENTNAVVNADGTVSVSFKDVTTSTFEPFDDGKYPSKVTGSRTKVSKTSGFPYVEIKFTINTDEIQNRSVWRNYSLKPTALWAFKQFLMRTGQFTEEELAAEDFTYDPNDIMGAEVIVDVFQEPYKDNDGNDKVRMSVKEVLADDGSSTWG